MAAPFEVELITPQRTLYSGFSEQLSVPGSSGSLGILANHAPLLTSLKVGEAVLTEPGGAARHFYIGGGFLEVNRNRVTILAEDAIGEEDMELAEAERLEREARTELDSATAGADTADAQLRLERAAARLRVVQRRR